MKDLCVKSEKKVPLVALVVGHEPTRPGACTPGQGVEGCEYFENGAFVEMVAKRLSQRGRVRHVVVFRENGYSKLPGEINALEPDFGVSFHSNAFDGKASGTETLYARGSQRGEKLARLLQATMVRTLQLPDRGLKPVVRSDPGGHLLWETRMPFALVEPFFNDNIRDDARFHGVRPQLVDAMASAIEAYALEF